MNTQERDKKQIPKRYAADYVVEDRKKSVSKGYSFKYGKTYAVINRKSD